MGPAVPRQAGHVDDVAVLLGDHGRQEGLQGPEVSEDVDIECPDDLGVRSVQQGRPGDNPSVVHQDGDVAHGRLGLLGILVDSFPYNEGIERYREREREMGLLGGHVHGVRVSLLSLRFNHCNCLLIADLLKKDHDIKVRSV